MADANGSGGTPPAPPATPDTPKPTKAQVKQYKGELDQLRKDQDGARAQIQSIRAKPAKKVTPADYAAVDKHQAGIDSGARRLWELHYLTNGQNPPDRDED